MTHHDAQCSNLFGTDRDASPRRTTAIDRSFLGLAPVGQDLGHHLACNVYNDPVDVDEAWRHDLASTDAYLTGLRQGGWDGDVRPVRSARGGLADGSVSRQRLVELIEIDEEDADPDEPCWPDRVAQRDGLTVPQVMARWARCLDFFLDLGEEARGSA